jgi:hypothetical protein
MIIAWGLVMRIFIRRRPVGVLRRQLLLPGHAPLEQMEQVFSAFIMPTASSVAGR